MSDLDDICASAGVRSHVTLEGRLAVAGVCCGVSTQRWQIIRCKEADHITCHTLPQPISGPIQIHSSTYTHLHFTYRTPARVQVPVTSIFNLREASNEVKYFYSFIPDICFNLLWNSCNAEGDVGTVSSGGVTITSLSRHLLCNLSSSL